MMTAYRLHDEVSASHMDLQKIKDLHTNSAFKCLKMIFQIPVTMVIV